MNFFLFMFLSVLLNVVELKVISMDGAPTCRNEDGNPVDWFYIYKLPKIKNHPNKLINDGTAYVYITPDKVNNGWTLSSKSINDTASIPGWTLFTIYQNNDIASIIYNDESPNELTEFEVDNLVDNTSGGHTKGVVMGDINTGLWLVHSVPKYPPLPSKGAYSYPFTGTRYGQTFLCLSLTAETLNNVSKQLWYNEPLISYSSIPSSFHLKYYNLVKLAEGNTDVKTPWYRAESFTTKLGLQLVSFAKSSTYHDDLYSGLVAPGLKSNLVVETWRNEPNPLNAECSKKFQVCNIKELYFSQLNITFSSHMDHSKWCSSMIDQNTYWICIGDINRALPQEKRGGGTVCTLNDNLWKHFSSIVQSSETCAHSVIQI